MLPLETRLALFPRGGVRVRIGRKKWMTLHPITLERAAVMEAMNCGFLNGPLTAGKALVAAWVLTLDGDALKEAGRGSTDGAKGFVASLKESATGVARIVNEEIQYAMLPFIPAKSEGSASADGIPEGCGWPLEMVEALCAHYGWSFDEAMKTETARAFALVAVARARSGGEHGGPDYYNRIRVEGLKQMGIIPDRAKEA